MALTSNGLIRTDTGRNDIEFVDTLAYNSSYNILKRTGTGRSDIAWESINTGSDTSGVTAGTSDVLDGKYFVNSSGSRLEGTMPNRGNGPVASTSRVVGNNNVYFRMNPGRYTSSYSGSIYNTTSEADKPEVYATYAQVASLVGLTAGKLLQGQTVLGIAGTGTGDGTAAAADILSGKTAYVDGSKITGSMSNQGAKTASLNCGGSYTIPKGYHNGSGKVTANSLSSQTSATAIAADIVSGKTAWVNGSKITGTYTGRKSINKVLYNGNIQYNGAIKNILSSYSLSDYDISNVYGFIIKITVESATSNGDSTATFLLPTSRVGTPSIYAMSAPSSGTYIPVGSNQVNFMVTYSAKKLSIEVRYNSYKSTVTFITNVTLQYTIGA